MMYLPRPRFCLALAASLLLHLALLAGHWPAPALKPTLRLEARLVVPEAAENAKDKPLADPGILEKNTLDSDEPAQPPPQPPPLLRKPTPAPQDAAKRTSEVRPPPLPPAQDPATAARHALRKLSEYILYPAAAKAAGHEGTVHLLIRVDADGIVNEASVAASSGYPELDHAAVEAALRAGRLDTGGRRELLLPITFRLQ